MAGVTPLMQQYLRLKKAYSDCILLFQMGDFYECFYEDAEILARELGIVLTSREKGEGAPPMAGFPIKALDTYLPKLVKKGYKVAIANQVEDPRFAKGLVERKVVEVVTQGTTTVGDQVFSKESNEVWAIYQFKGGLYIAMADLLTLRVKVASFPLKRFTPEELIKRFSPTEVLVDDSNSELINKLKDKTVLIPVRRSTYDAASLYLKNLFGTRYNALGFRDQAEEYVTYMLLKYFEDSKQRQTDKWNIERLEVTGYMDLDPTTIRNLDIFRNNMTFDEKHSLLGVVDKTMTPMGGRLLREWLLYPLKDRERLQDRLEDVESIIDTTSAVKTLGELLKDVYDIQRIAGLISLGKVTPKQLIMLKRSIKASLKALDYLKRSGIAGVDLVPSGIADAVHLVEKYLVDDPASTPKEGPVIASEVSEELKNLRRLVYETEDVLNSILERERQKTGIERLKLGFNKVFGYYLEVPKTQVGKVPPYFVRKQTLVNSERYITPELKEFEEKILSAQEQLIELESRLYTNLVEKLQGYIPSLLKLADVVAYWDVIRSLAEVAIKYNYTKPEFLDNSDEVELELVEARHPVVERFVEEFIPNSIQVVNSANFIILTGPNMGGKSTFIRQVALIQLLAQIGSFVPAKVARLKIRDKIFARVGASDDITTGRSTFMVEMSEVAYILRNATSQSLIVLDEIGRGTSTHEGFALAHAISRYIKDNIGALTFFATHFHEITQLEDKYKGFINYKVDVLEEGDNVYFLHTVSKGRASKSYGIHIAKLVKLPSKVIREAEEVLYKIAKGDTLYKSAYSPVQLGFDTVLEGGSHNYNAGPGAPYVADNSTVGKIIDELEQVDINKITPLQALEILAKLKNLQEKYDKEG